MNTNIYPTCTGSCTNWSNRMISNALHQQRDHLSAVSEHITTLRLMAMTPQSMRAESEQLGLRIKAARASILGAP
jgi:hypothetical protein